MYPVSTPLSFGEGLGVRKMKNGVYDLLKARFLIEDDAIKSWRFIVFLIFLAIIMIANTQSFERKVFKIAELTNEVKELRSEFVDRR